MNPSQFSDIQSVRLASGIEMQQRWSMHQGQDQQKSNQAMPRLIDISPSKGNQGTIVTVVVQSLNQQAVSVKLAFNSLVVDTKQMQAQGITSLVASVPPFQHINATSSNVPISVCVVDKDSVIETWPIAEFTYDFESTNNLNSSDTPTSTSRAVEDNYFNTNYNGFYQPYPQYTYPYTTPTTPTNHSQFLDNTTTSMLASAFNTSSASPTAATLSYPGSAFSQRPSSVPSTPTFCQKPVTAHIPATSVANYQPYPGLVSRANLKIMKDLDSMTQNWTSEEWEHRRRLVQFWREKVGNDIRCTFDSVSQSERITNTGGQIVVSCIYWAERNDWFITSVDCIHLLESLMDIRFSVEEKNRVRRNLEGFRPLTVSKCKAESAEFFKLIMGFPNPKPRNIEKDVKVFPWKTLPYALKKIVTKYTASSYSSNHTKPRPQLKSSNTTLTNTAYSSYAMSTPSVYSSTITSNQDQPTSFL